MEGTLIFRCFQQRYLRALRIGSKTGSETQSLQLGTTLVEIIMALGIFAAVTVIIASIMETTFKAQRQAELKSDLQSFFMRLNQEIDCEKTFKVGEASPLYNHATATFPTNATCGYLTLKDSRGDVIHAPNPSALSQFVGAGAISKNWWARVGCDETQRSITISVALRKRGNWTEFGKNPLRDPKDASDTQHFMNWTNSINPVYGGASRPKLCERYFTNTENKRQNCTTGQFATGYNSEDFRCAPLPTPLAGTAGECGVGEIMTSFNLRTNTPVCQSLTTADLDANPSLGPWIRGQLVPQCYNGQFFLADGTSSNVITCGEAFQAIRCNHGTTLDYFPGSSTACNGMSGYTGTSGSIFDFRQMSYMSNSN